MVQAGLQYVQKLMEFQDMKNVDIAEQVRCCSIGWVMRVKQLRGKPLLSVVPSTHATICSI
jgi:hypothetical protein